MSFDPSRFSQMVVSDTCAVWNMLSARRLFSAAVAAKVYFCITSMVAYECFFKPRSRITAESEELMKRLQNAQKNGAFRIQPCGLDDLLNVTRTAPKGLGAGELSCIAVAYNIRSLAFMTDEKQARYHAEVRLNLAVETTPRLYGFLHFHRHLSDSDHAEIIAEHERFEQRPLTSFFNEAYEHAMRSRCMASPPK